MKFCLKLVRSSVHEHCRTEPEDYLAASSELLFATMVVSFIITKLVNPQQLLDNPIRRMVGYNNPCVFWDEKPATLVAAWMFAPMIYLGIRYAVTDSMRAKLSNPDDPAKRNTLYLYLNWAYAISQIICSGIFVVTPQDGMLTSMRVHSFCFVQLIPMLGLAIAANYHEGYKNGVPFSNAQWIGLALICVLTVLETFFASTAVFLYKNDGVFVHDPTLMQMIDYGWFASLPIAAHYMPRSPDIFEDFSLAPDENKEQCHPPNRMIMEMDAAQKRADGARQARGFTQVRHGP